MQIHFFPVCSSVLPTLHSKRHTPNPTLQILHPQSCEQGADLFDSGAETLTALNFAICTPQMLHTKRYNPSPTPQIPTPKLSHPNSYTPKP